MTKPRPLDGRAIFGKLKDIDKTAPDLVVVDRELKALIQEIERGEYDSTTTSAEQVVEELENFMQSLPDQSLGAIPLWNQIFKKIKELRAERERDLNDKT